MEVVKNNGTFFYQLNRNKVYENISENTRKPSIANTYKNESEVDKVYILANTYARIGQQKFADPFAFKSRPYYNEYDGRNLHILNTLKRNANLDFPDVITKNRLKVVGFY